MATAWRWHVYWQRLKVTTVQQTCGSVSFTKVSLIHSSAARRCVCMRAHTHTHTTYGSRRLCVLADNSCIFRAQKRSAVWDTAGLSDVLHGLRGEHWLGGTANPERERERRKGRKRKEIRPHTRVLVMRGWCHLNKCSPNIINTVLLAN